MILGTGDENLNLNKKTVRTLFVNLMDKFRSTRD